MTSETRTCLAYIAGCLISGLPSSNIYDQASATSTNVGGSLNPEYVNIYDYSRGCYLSGHGSEANYALFDYGVRGHLSLSLNEVSFAGHDHDTNKAFSGSVNGRTVLFYDDECSEWFTYFF